MVLKIGDGLLIGHTEPFPSSGVVRGSAQQKKLPKVIFVLFYSTHVQYTVRESRDADTKYRSRIA